MKPENKLGKAHEVDETSERDAIHIAIMLVRSDEDLYPCQSVKLIAEGKVRALLPDEKPDGIIDPFLDGPIYAKFQDFGVYMLMFPNSVSNLRHEWDYEIEGKEEEIPYDYSPYDECRDCE